MERNDSTTIAAAYASMAASAAIAGRMTEAAMCALIAYLYATNGSGPTALSPGADSAGPEAAQASNPAA